MVLKGLLFASASVAAITVAGAAFAQTISTPAAGATQSTASQGDPAATSTVEEVVVTGVRRSLASAQSIKRDSQQIVDSIVAEDIGKLPDNNVAEALQRVTGVQITRGQGEGNGVLIRGLPNVQTTLNGREIFTTTGRYVSLQDIPAELVAGVDVYKTLSPGQLEGGVAGNIDVRLRRPFDFAGAEVAGGGRMIYADQAKKWSPIGSLLVSDRWTTPIGEVGALLSVSYQQRKFLNEDLFNFVQVAATDPSTGAGITVPQTTGAIYTGGNRKRPAVSFSAQWKPNEEFDFYVDGLYLGYRNTYNNRYFIGLPGNGALQSVDLFPGTNIASGLTSTNSYTLTSTQAYKDRTDTYQGAVGGRWRHEALTVTSDLAYTYSKFTDRAMIVDTSFNAPVYSVDFDNKGAAISSVSGVNVDDASNYTLRQLFDNRSKSVGKEIAWRADAVYTLDTPILKSLNAGFRFSHRKANSQATNGSGIPITDPVLASSIPGFGDLSPSGILSGDRDVQIGQWYSANPEFLLSNSDLIRSIFGQDPGPAPYDPAKAFGDVEKTYAGYVQANYAFDLGSLPVDGGFGLRVVRTDVSLAGFQQVVDNGSSTGEYEAVGSDKQYTNWLPSFSTRIKFRPDIQGRFAFGKVVTRPDFSALNPAVSLNSPGATLIGTGSGGNPDLAPIKSTNYDASLEWYFAKAGSVSVGAFYRDLKGYIQTYGTTETIGGIDYDVSRPRNTGDGTLKGIEAGYQQFYDFLPGPFSGLGSQLNFTYIDGKTQAPVELDPSGGKQDLVNVSKYSFNAVGIYEKYGASVRLAYNWRSKYTVEYNSGGLQPNTIYQKPTSELDLTVAYDVSKQLTLTFDATNLLRKVERNYFGDDSLYPRDAARADRTYQVGLRFRM